jgi:hypothetical protein
MARVGGSLEDDDFVTIAGKLKSRYEVYDSGSDERDTTHELQASRGCYAVTCHEFRPGPLGMA